MVAERDQLLSRALRALCLTRDYVGYETLPAIDGWEWYEAGKLIAAVIPNDPWATQFRLQVAYQGEPSLVEQFTGKR